MKDKLSEQRIALLHPKIRTEVLNLLNQAETLIDDNLAIRVVQGLRTIEEQNALFAQGRTTPGSIVTNAMGGRSYHNYGLAIDFCFLFEDEDGKYQYDEKKSWLVGKNHKLVVDLFKSNKYIWGGDFKTIKDAPHLEKSFGYTTRQLFDKYNKKDFIKDTIYINL